MDDVTGIQIDYIYDALNRIESAVPSDEVQVPAYAYQYDDRSNRDVVTIAGQRTEYVYDAANLLVSDTDAAGIETTYTHDGAGRLTGISDGTVIDYGQFGNTTSYETDDVATDFSYPAADQGERATTGGTALDNTLLGITGQTTDGDRASFTRLPDGRLLAAHIDGETLYYLTDGLGSTVAMTNLTGETINTYRYGPYGEAEDTVEGIAQPFQYAGGYHPTLGGADAIDYAAACVTGAAHSALWAASSGGGALVAGAGGCVGGLVTQGLSDAADHY